MCLEAPIMVSHVALPREGDLERLHRMIGYLNKYHDDKLLFDISNTLNDFR